MLEHVADEATQRSGDGAGTPLTRGLDRQADHGVRQRSRGSMLSVQRCRAGADVEEHILDARGARGLRVGGSSIK